MYNCFKFKYLSFIFYCGFPPVHMQTFLVYTCSLDFRTFCSETRNQNCIDNYRWFARTAASPRTSGLRIGCPWRRVAETCRARMSSLGPTGPKYQNTDDDDSQRFFCTRNKKHNRVVSIHSERLPWRTLVFGYDTETRLCNWAREQAGPDAGAEECGYTTVQTPG